VGRPSDLGQPVESHHDPGEPDRRVIQRRATGSRRTIAILELGGGFDPADLATYFRGLGIPPPTVQPRSLTNKGFTLSRPEAPPKKLGGQPPVSCVTNVPGFCS